MLAPLRATMTDVVERPASTTSRDIGITVPKATGGTASDGRQGRPARARRRQADRRADADWTAVNSFFGTFATGVETFVKTQTGGSGVIDERLKSGDRSLAPPDRISCTKTNERLDAKEKRLKAQFAAMELALQKSQTQQAWLTGQLASLNATTG